MVVTTDYGLRRGRLEVEGTPLLEAMSPESMSAGVSGVLPVSGETLTMRATAGGGVEVLLDGVPVRPEDQLTVPPSRSAWAHAWIALSGSLLGFVASGLYLLRSEALADPWAFKMSVHMAGWHLLLALTLFPASVWGQRGGIRSVQATSVVFFLIHLGIAVANSESAEPRAHGTAIALLNGASGLAFLASALYGQRAWRDMDPLVWPGERPSSVSGHCVRVSRGLGNLE